MRTWKGLCPCFPAEPQSSKVIANKRLSRVRASQPPTRVAAAPLWDLAPPPSQEYRADRWESQGRTEELHSRGVRISTEVEQDLEWEGRGRPSQKIWEKPEGITALTNSAVCDWGTDAGSCFKSEGKTSPKSTALLWERWQNLPVTHNVTKWMSSSCLSNSPTMTI